MVNLTAITKRCPIHGKPLILDEVNQVWRCPVPGCYYSIPADSAAANTEIKE